MADDSHQSLSQATGPIVVAVLVVVSILGLLFLRQNRGQSPVSQSNSSVSRGGVAGGAGGAGGIDQLAESQSVTSAGQAGEAGGHGDSGSGNGGPIGTAIRDTDHIRGDRDAPVVLVEYGDLECPFCKRLHPTMTDLREENDEQVAWVFRHFAVPSHQNAPKAAEASECVAELVGEDAFWQFVDIYYQRTTSNGRGFPLSGLPDLAEEVGANRAEFQSCLDSGRMATKVAADMQTGRQLGVSGTPGTILVAGGQVQGLIPGALPKQQFQQVIDRFL